MGHFRCSTRHDSVRTGRWRDVATQFALVFGAAIFYFLVRGVTQGSVERAERNADWVLQVEREIGLDLETNAQDVILGHRLLVTLANWVYIWGHWPVIIATLFALHKWRPVDYLRFRNALFVSGAIGIVIYVTFPVAPPRLLDPIFHDTVTNLSTSYRVLQPPALVNKYAAMPSLHAGWNLLAGIALYGATRNRWLRSVAVVGPIAMAFAVVLTANHYLLDVVVGEVVALVGLALSLRWWPHPTWVSSNTVDDVPRSTRPWPSIRADRPGWIRAPGFAAAEPRSRDPQPPGHGSLPTGWQRPRRPPQTAPGRQQRPLGRLLRVVGGVRWAAGPQPNRADQLEVVDDQALHTGSDQLLGSDDLGDPPGDDRRGQCEQGRQTARRQEPFVDRNAVVR